MTHNPEFFIREVRAVEGGARLLVELVEKESGHAEWLSLLCARLTHLPTKGDVSPETVYDLRREAAVCTAIAAGLRALGAAGCSPRHLVQKLRARGTEETVAREAVAELAEKGYLREEEGALREAERGLAKLWGDRRILADLQAKGYESGALQYAAARLRTEDGAARCAALLRKRRMALPADEAQARKLFAALTRYGYTATEIRKALQSIKK
jgi:SOS response regulatory protein OraA/RecX